MLRALGDYGRLMVFPGNLHMERTIFDPGNYLSRESWRKTAASEYLSILGLVVLAAFYLWLREIGDRSAHAHHWHGLVFRAPICRSRMSFSLTLRSRNIGFICLASAF